MQATEWIDGKFGKRRCRDGANCTNRKCGFAHPTSWPFHSGGKAFGRKSGGGWGGRTARHDSVELRIDPSDGQAYSQAQFLEFYGGLLEWEQAYPLTFGAGGGSSGGGGGGSAAQLPDAFDDEMLDEMDEIEAAMMGDLYSDLTPEELDELDREFEMTEGAARYDDQLSSGGFTSGTSSPREGQKSRSSPENAGSSGGGGAAAEMASTILRPANSSSSSSGGGGGAAAAAGSTASPVPASAPAPGPVDVAADVAAAPVIPVPTSDTVAKIAFSQEVLAQLNLDDDSDDDL